MRGCGGVDDEGAAMPNPILFASPSHRNPFKLKVTAF